MLNNFFIVLTKVNKIIFYLITFLDDETEKAILLLKTVI